MKKFDRPLTREEIAALRDEDIDFSDIPELDEDFWSRATLLRPDPADSRLSNVYEPSPTQEPGFVKDEIPPDEPGV